MKTILIFPPIWTTHAPHLSIPTLAGQLISNGFKTKSIDLNIDFFDHVLSKPYLKRSIKHAENELDDTIQQVAEKQLSFDNIENYSIKEKEILLKNQSIKEYMETKKTLLKKIPNIVEKAKAEIKNKRKFYDPELLITNLDVLNKALEIVSLPYSPNKILLNVYENASFSPDFETIEYLVKESKNNIFKDYYKKILPKIIKEKPDLIGISIGGQYQVLAGLTLAYMLKQETDAHINIGGNHFSRIPETFKSNPQIFDSFVDSISFGEGEKPIVQLAKYVNKEVPIDKVPNLMYKMDNKVLTNGTCTPLELNETALPNYTGYKFDKYITSEIVLPVQAHKGCYWGRCTFCDISHGNHFNSKKIENFVNELKNYKKKYKITNFEIVDEAIPAKYFENLADKLIEEKLNIKYHTYARTEKTFTSHILEKLKKSGLEMVLWGIESNSPRVLKLLNKGVNCEERIKLLKRATEKEIWNHGFIFYGFPTETIEEAQETIDLINTHHDIINSWGHCRFFLPKNCQVSKNKEKFGITVTPDSHNNFSTILKIDKGLLTEEELWGIEKGIRKALKDKYQNSIWQYITNQEYLFLYLKHFGVNWVKNKILDNSKLKQKRKY